MIGAREAAVFKFSKTSYVNMEGINPILMSIAERALELSRIDFGIPSTGGLRSAEEQNKLFKRGVTTLDGYEAKSYHQTGNALDVFAYVDGAASWDEAHLTVIAAAMLQAANEFEVSLRWGGHWKNFVDMPHFEIPDET
jgi:peptidoglycan L-alanyl-D-glutamate endopeptidase CwlK